MKLSDIAVKKAKPKAKPYKMADGEGMYLEVMPTGSKYWRLNLWSLRVSANWRITFEFENGDAYILDLEDYH